MSGSYFGTLSDHETTGFGVVESPNGTITLGTFIKNHQSGFGALFTRQGSLFLGSFGGGGTGADGGVGRWYGGGGTVVTGRFRGEVEKGGFQLEDATLCSVNGGSGPYFQLVGLKASEAFPLRYYLVIFMVMWMCSFTNFPSLSFSLSLFPSPSSPLSDGILQC